MIRLGILGSTRGSTMLALIKAIEERRLAARIEVVISNREDAVILSRAREYGLRSVFIPANGLGREAYDMKISECLKAQDVNLLVLIGYMRILSARFVQDWPNRVINVHPSLLPAFAGKMDLDVHKAVIEAREKKTGCTVHFVTEAVDSGPIILQKSCPVRAEDTPELLKQRVQALEAETLVEAIIEIEREL